MNAVLSTPHARGSTSNKQVAYSDKGVYPACAGIHLSLPSFVCFKTGLPRMRGDPPLYPRRL